MLAETIANNPNVSIPKACEEWQAVYILNKKTIPKTVPPPGEMVQLIA
ncbi:IS4 family transposase [Cardiobacterium valvarum]|nr:IS4 family transposase [Cardiobacterium valvarum]